METHGEKSSVFLVLSLYPEWLIEFASGSLHKSGINFAVK